MGGGHGGASGEASFALGGCKLGSCAEPAPVESSPNDIPVFPRTFQVLWGYLSDTHKQRGQCNYTEPVFWVLFLCCSIFFFFEKDTGEQVLWRQNHLWTGQPCLHHHQILSAA